MSNKIASLNLSHLLVATHYEFHRKTNALILEATAEALKLTELAPQYTAAVNQLFLFVNRAQGNVLSQKIEELDRQRDALLSEIFTIIDYAAKSPIATRKEPGAQLKRISAPYRGIMQNEYEKETAQIRGFIRDLGATPELIEAQETLSLQMLMTELKKANNKLSEYIVERSTEISTTNATLNGDTKQQRKVVDALYHAIVDRVNAVANLESTPAVETYILAQNGLVAQYKSILTHMRAGGTGTEKGTGGKEEETPEVPEIPGNE